MSELPDYDYPSLNIGQVAKRIHRSEATVFRLMRQGKAPASYKVGHGRLFAAFLAPRPGRAAQGPTRPGTR